jgi:hypothetical protein
MPKDQGAGILLFRVGTAPLGFCTLSEGLAVSSTDRFLYMKNFDIVHCGGCYDP